MFPNMPRNFEELKEFFEELKEFFKERKEFLAERLSELSVEKVKDFFGNLTWKQLAAGAGGIFAAVLILAALLFGRGGSSREELEGGIPIYAKVRPGMSAREIGEEFQRRGIVRNKYEFWLMAKFYGYESKFLAGNYAFRAGMDTKEVLEKLMQGDVSEFKFVIPEGFTVMDIAKRLESEGIVNREEFLEEAEDFAPYDYMENAKGIRYRAEGFLFPATYELSPDISSREILETMSRTFDQRLTSSMRNRARKMGLSIYDLVILASLVEKEALYEEDRPIIAQVLFKRLEIGMPLQCDASLQYLMDAPKEDVSIADTKIESPYNTYQNKGLPPGPIANPGMDSIKAVLYPADTDYLYFVADRDGHNYYSYTYDEHLEIVEKVR